MASQLALYFFQGEHGESELTPNACMINAAGKPVVLSQFTTSIAGGEQGPFAFRFKMADKQCGYVWKDVSDPAERLPEYEGVIFAKILRLSAVSRRPLHTRLRRRLPDGFKQRPFNPPSHEPESTTTRASSSAAKSSTPQSATQKRSPVPNSASPNAHAKQTPTKPKPAPAATNGGGVGIGAAPAKKPAQPVVSPAAARTSAAAADTTNRDSFETFLSGTGSSGSSSQSKTVHTEDFMSFSEPAVVRPVPTADLFGAPASAAVGSGESPGIDVDEPAGGNGNGVSGGSAFELYQQVEEMNKKRSDEMEEARLALGPRLTQWAEDNGKKRNVRTLLTTMHDVLWEGAKWKPVTLVDVIDPKKVKLVYRRAMLVVHPDRNGNLSGTEMFIAKRVFEAINEAYSEFLEHEQP